MSAHVVVGTDTRPHDATTGERNERKDALGHRVVPAVALSTHATTRSRRVRTATAASPTASSRNDQVPSVGIAATDEMAGLPVIALFTVSVAVIVWLPGVLKVALNVPVRLVSGASGGSVACESLLVKCSVPP